MNREPLVSVCIPTYNGAKYIAEALESVFNQSYKNLEIVVSDDDSSDDTLQIVKDYENQSIPMHIFNHQPKGIGANWNNCLRHAKGKYIKFLFQDDVLLPNCITLMVSFLENNSDIPIVGTKREFIVEHSFKNKDSDSWITLYKDLQKNLELETHNDVLLIDKKIFSSPEFFKSPLNKVGEPSVVLFKKDLVKQYGYFREDLKQVLDYEYFYRVLDKYKIAVIVNPLVKFRLHDQQATVKNKSNDIYHADHEIYKRIVYKRYLNYLDDYHKKVFKRKYNYLYKLLYYCIDNVKNIFRLK